MADDRLLPEPIEVRIVNNVLDGVYTLNHALALRERLLREHVPNPPAAPKSPPRRGKLRTQCPYCIRGLITTGNVQEGCAYCEGFGYMLVDSR